MADNEGGGAAPATPCGLRIEPCGRPCDLDAGHVGICAHLAPCHPATNDPRGAPPEIKSEGQPKP